ncbi:MAG: ATP-binding cassette domain-containing protein [Beduini sp.]
MLSVKNIKIQYPDQLLIKQERLRFYPGYLSLISGESGCGKTSLLYVLGQLNEHHFADLYYQNQPIKTKNEIELYRKNVVGYVFQDKNLHEDLTIFQNLNLFAMIANHQLTLDDALDLLERVDLKLEVNRLVSTLSGGEKQRVAIACALAKQPAILIADEPTSSLDEKNKLNIVNILKNIAHDKNIIVIVASHDRCFLEHSDLIYKIKNQHIEINNEKEIQSNENQPLPLTKLPKNFFKIVLKYKSKSYFKSINFILWLCFLLICLGSLALSTNQNIINSFVDKIESLKVSDIYITNLTKQEDLEFIKTIQGVKSVDPYYEIGNVTLNHSNDLTVLLHTYYPKDLRIQGLTEINQSVYLSSDLKEENLELVEFEILGKMYSFNIGGYYHQAYKDIYKPLSPVVYLPVEFFKQFNIPTTSYIIETIDSSNIDQIIDKITIINPDIQMSSQYSDTQKLLSLQQNMKIYIQIGVFVLTLIVTLSVALSQILEINSRLYEICIFQANGLQKKSLFKLEFYRLMFLWLIGNVFIDILGTVILMICKQLFFSKLIVFNPMFYLTVAVLTCISMIIPAMFSLYQVSKVSAEKMLRS